MPGVMRRHLAADERRDFPAQHSAAELQRNTSTPTTMKYDDYNRHHGAHNDDSYPYYYYYYYEDYDENEPLAHPVEHSSSRPSTAKPAAAKGRTYQCCYGTVRPSPGNPTGTRPIMDRSPWLMVSASVLSVSVPCLDQNEKVHEAKT